MLVPAGSPFFFLREHRFTVLCRVVTLRQLLWRYGHCFEKFSQTRVQPGVLLKYEMKRNEAEGNEMKQNIVKYK